MPLYFVGQPVCDKYCQFVVLIYGTCYSRNNYEFTAFYSGVINMSCKG